MTCTHVSVSIRKPVWHRTSNFLGYVNLVLWTSGRTSSTGDGSSHSLYLHNTTQTQMNKKGSVYIM